MASSMNLRPALQSTTTTINRPQSEHSSSILLHRRVFESRLPLPLHLHSSENSTRRIPCTAQWRPQKPGKSRSQGPRSIQNSKSRRSTRQGSQPTSKRSKSPVCSRAVPADVADPKIPEFQLSASEDPNPIGLPSYSAEGYYEWHHSSHIPVNSDGAVLLPPTDVSIPTAGSESGQRTTQGSSEREESSLEQTKKLLSVPVLTKEEQLELAATPAHPAALTALYATYVACCLAEKVWRFGLPAIMAMFLPSMQPIAVLSFTCQLIIFVGAPWVGHFMDSTPRVSAFNTLAVVQTVAMVTSAAATVWGLSHPPSPSVSGGALLRQPWFLVVMATGAVDKLTGLASGVAFERDWVILLAGQNRPIALASANAILRRVDLFCELAGPMTFGWLLSSFPPFFCLKVAMGLALVSLPVLLLLVHATDRLSSGALGRPREKIQQTPQQQQKQTHQQPSLDNHSSERSANSSHTPSPSVSGSLSSSELLDNNSTVHQHQHAMPSGGHDDVSKGENPFSAIVSGWRSFLGQSVLPASLAYVLLYFNAVLSPGGLMTSFLTQRGIDVSIIGAFRGACAAMGFAATFVSAPLVARLGLLNAGAGALVFQSALLALSVGVYYLSKSHQTHQTVLLMLFLGLVVFSRLGHWVYDVIDAQIFQTAVPSSEANLVGTTEIALASLAELVMLGTAIVLHDVSRFGQLAMLSMASVLGATAIYCVWLAKPDPKRNAMFPKRPEWTFGRDDSDSTEEGERGVKTAPAAA